LVNTDLIKYENVLLENDDNIYIKRTCDLNGDAFIYFIVKIDKSLRIYNMTTNCINNTEKYKFGFRYILENEDVKITIINALKFEKVVFNEEDKRLYLNDEHVQTDAKYVFVLNSNESIDIEEYRDDEIENEEYIERNKNNVHFMKVAIHAGVMGFTKNTYHGDMFGRCTNCLSKFYFDESSYEYLNVNQLYKIFNTKTYLLRNYMKKRSYTSWMFSRDFNTESKKFDNQHTYCGEIENAETRALMFLSDNKIYVKLFGKYKINMTELISVSYISRLCLDKRII
jgi:hypothetical protein